MDEVCVEIVFLVVLIWTVPALSPWLSSIMVDSSSPVVFPVSPQEQLPQHSSQAGIEWPRKEKKIVKVFLIVSKCQSVASFKDKPFFFVLVHWCHRHFTLIKVEFSVKRWKYSKNMLKIVNSHLVFLIGPFLIRKDKYLSSSLVTNTDL